MIGKIHINNFCTLTNRGIVEFYFNKPENNRKPIINIYIFDYTCPDTYTYLEDKFIKTDIQQVLLGIVSKKPVLKNRQVYFHKLHQMEFFQTTEDEIQDTIVKIFRFLDKDIERIPSKL